MHTVHPLRTSRLTLIPCTLSLTREILSGAGVILDDIEVPAEWLKTDIRELLSAYQDRLALDPSLLGWVIWLVVHREDRIVIGDVEFLNRPGPVGMVEIGYSIMFTYRNEGYATEAARALVNWALRQPGVVGVTAKTTSDNWPSLRVLQKLGMCYTGTDDGFLNWELTLERKMISRLPHVQITIPRGSEAVARHFYCEVLRLPEVEKPESLQARGGFWLNIGDQQVHVGVEDGVERQKTKAHIAYQVSDLAAWRARLAEHGISILESIPIPGYDRMEFRDPFGNRIEFIQPLPEAETAS